MSARSVRGDRQPSRRPTSPARRRRLGIAVLTLTALLATACGGSSADTAAGDDPPEPQPGGEIVVGTQRAFNYIDPLRSISDTEMNMNTAVYDTLFTGGEDGVEPSLATDYEISEDGLTYTLTLREGVLFHDGTEFDSEAVRVNLERVADPENGCNCASRYERMEAIETPDEHTVEIHLSEPDGSFLATGLAGTATGMVSPAAIEEFGDEVGHQPVGTGPFRFVEQVAGAEFTVEKWDQYWDEGRPLLDGITYRVMTDTESRFASLQSGAIHVAEGLEAGNVEPAEQDERVDVEVIPGLGTTFVQFNVTRPPFDDVEARRAACTAIDRDSMNEALNYGLNDTAVNALFPPAHDYYPGELEHEVSYDPDEAQRMVQDLGGLAFSLNVGEGSAREGEVLQEQWSNAGMDVEVRPLEMTAMVRQSYDLTYDAAFVNMFGRYDPDNLPRTLLHSESSGNVTGLDDPEVDRLIDAGRQEQDPEERREIYRELNERLAEITPHCYLWATNYYLGTADGVHGVRQGPDGEMWLTDVYLEQ